MGIWREANERVAALGWSVCHGQGMGEANGVVSVCASHNIEGFMAVWRARLFKQFSQGISLAIRLLVCAR